MVPAATVGSGRRLARAGAGPRLVAMTEPVAAAEAVVALAARPWWGGGILHDSSNIRTTGGRSAPLTVLGTHAYSFCTNNSVAQTPK